MTNSAQASGEGATGDLTLVVAKNHKSIWLAPVCNIDERTWCEDDPGCCDDCGLPSVKYIRVDLVDINQAMLTALRGAMVIIECMSWPESGLTRTAFDRRREAIIAAIAKAEGHRSPDTNPQSDGR